jgi:hypothetical protein
LKTGGGKSLAVEKSKPRNGRSAGNAKGEQEGADSFAYGDDDGGKLLADRLTPHRVAPAALSGHATRPQPPKPFPAEVTTDLPIPTNTAKPPGPQVKPPPSALRPRSAPVEFPLSWDRSDPQLPARTVLPETGRARAPSVGANTPAPLPPLAQAAPERASLADPTFWYSIAAAAGTIIPPRTAKVPFLILGLPDPFEKRRTVRLRELPDEGQLPLSTGSGAPRK